MKTTGHKFFWILGLVFLSGIFLLHIPQAVEAHGPMGWNALLGPGQLFEVIGQNQVSLVHPSLFEKVSRDE
jgi:hypothetical protein